MFIRVIAIVISTLLLVSAAVAAERTAATARAEMKDTEGKAAGKIMLTQMAQGVLIRVELDGLPPGWHAIHIHETASCEPPFASAGQHFNPGDEQHGFDANGTHAGDLPNIHVSDDGTARAEVTNNRIALVTEQPTDVNVLNRAIGTVRSAAGMSAHNLFTGRGTSIIVHAGADDYRTDPAGNAGDRIACGIITRE